MNNKIMSKSQLDIAIDIYKRISILLAEMSDGSSQTGEALRKIVTISMAEDMRALKEELEDHGIRAVLQGRSN